MNPETLSNHFKMLIIDKAVINFNDEKAYFKAK